MNVEDKLNKMVGYTYMYHTILYKIIGYQCKNGIITIATNKNWIEFPKDKFEKAIKDFLPVSDENKENALQILPAKNELINLKKVIIDNITKIQSDPDYIKQANVINNSVNTLINMVKLQVNIIKSINEENI